MKIKSAILFAAMGACSVAQSQEIPTRFGLLKIDAEATLLYKGSPVKPQVRGNNGLSVLGTYQQGGTDVVLIQDNGGSACPAMLYFVLTYSGGVKATKPFGTCSDLIDVRQTNEGIVVSMPGFAGPFEPRTAQQRAAKAKDVFIFRDGVLTRQTAPLK